MRKDPIKEARRYVDNARDVLQERAELNTETRLYVDDKYVKAAGHYLWHSVLIALDAVFHVKSKQRPHPDVKSYYEAVGDRDRKLLAYVVSGYKIMHIAMGYDGNPSKATCDDGIRIATEIINRCSVMLA